MEYSQLLRLVETAPVNMAVIDLNFNYQCATTIWFDFIGASLSNDAEIIGHNFIESLPLNMLKAIHWREVLQHVLREQCEDVLTVPIMSVEKSYFWTRWQFVPVLDEQSHITAITIVAENYTQQQEWERFQTSHLDMLCTANQEGYFERVNAAFEHVLGYTKEELLSRPFFELVHPNDVQRTIGAVETLIKGSNVTNFKNRYICADGSYCWLEWVAITDPETGLILASAREITQRMKQELLLDLINDVQKLCLVNYEMSSIFDNILEHVLELTGSEYGFIGEVLYDNGQRYLRAYAITNIAWNSETHKFYADNAPNGLEFRNLESLFGWTLKTGQALISNDPGNDERRGGLPQGHPALNRYLGVPIYSANGFVGMVGVANSARDYDQELVDFIGPFLKCMGTIIESHKNQCKLKQYHDELVKANEKLDQLAWYDYLTELPNRANFDRELLARINHAERKELSFGVLFIDVDFFKGVNDNFGHDVGDQLLISIANRLMENLRDYDVVSRFGGDEFAVLLDDSDEAMILNVAEKLKQAISKEFIFADKKVCVSVSIGVSIYPDHGRSSEELMRHSDQGLYKAKSSGRNQFQIC